MTNKEKERFKRCSKQIDEINEQIEKLEKRKARYEEIMFELLNKDNERICPAGMIYKAYCKQGKGDEE